MTAFALKERNVGEQPKAARKQKRTFVAKPPRGEINFKSLRKAIVGRFPKTIAHLAK
jgi:hypothetical protein